MEKAMTAIEWEPKEHWQREYEILRSVMNQNEAVWQLVQMVQDDYEKKTEHLVPATPSVEPQTKDIPQGIKLCDCPECGAEIQHGLAKDVIDKFNSSKLFTKAEGTEGFTLEQMWLAYLEHSNAGGAISYKEKRQRFTEFINTLNK